MAKQPKRYFKYQGYRYGVDDEPDLDLGQLDTLNFGDAEIGGEDGDDEAVSRMVDAYLKNTSKSGGFTKSGVANSGTKSSSEFRKDSLDKMFTPSKSAAAASSVRQGDEPRTARQPIEKTFGGDDNSPDQTDNGYDDEIERVDEELRRRNGWRQRVVRGVIGAMAGYADPQLASQVISQFQQEEQLLRSRRQNLIEQRENERARDEEQAEDRAFRQRERQEDRDYDRESSTLAFERQRERDKAHFDQDEEMFERRVQAEIQQEQRRQDAEFKILNARNAAEIEQMRVGHGLSMAEASYRLNLQAAEERAARWEEMYGVDPEMARRVSQKVQAEEPLTPEERSFHAQILRLGAQRREMAELEQRAQIASRASSIEVPVEDPRTGGPMVTGSSLDRKVVTRPGTVQDLQGQPQPGGGGVSPRAQSVAPRIQQRLDNAGPNRQQVALTLKADIEGDSRWSEEDKRYLLSLLR